MGKKARVAFFVLLAVAVALCAVLWIYGRDAAVLNPKGLIGVKERDLMNVATWLMLLIVVPVFIMTFFVAWRYRAGNKKAKYDPNWDQSFLAEALWWGLPCVIIAILSVITWKSCHELDPFKPLETGKKPMTIQVVALQWKWLFIYPDYNIASVNWVQFPEQTPIYFEITSDAPMNSFWIPQLGGQIYAMPGMKTKLYLIANEMGNFRGTSANLSGVGFAGMNFTAKSCSLEEFNQWASSVQTSSHDLSFDKYRQLAEPSQNNPVTFYAVRETGVFDWIVMKYMMPMEAGE